jgi:hypothetical protein
MALLLVVSHGPAPTVWNIHSCTDLSSHLINVVIDSIQFILEHASICTCFTGGHDHRAVAKFHQEFDKAMILDCLLRRLVAK